MIPSKKHLFLAIVIGVSLLSSTQSYGLPAFARKYQMECTMCHEPVPRLNEFGYKFRAAGFRLPEEIGKGEASSDYSNYIAARVVFAATDASTKGSDNNTTVNQAGQSNISFSSASIYPLVGAFGPHVSAWSEFGYSPAAVNNANPGTYLGTINIGNAWMRLTYGDTASFWSFRIGLFSAIEGYGASDASIGVSSPLMKGAAWSWIPSTATKAKLASTLYTPGTGETGVEAGWNMDRLSIRLGLFNGGYVSNNSFQAAIGGNASKLANSPSYNSKDLMLFANYILDEHGGGIAAYAFDGSVDFANPVVAGNPNMFPDNYLRYGLYLTSPTFAGFKLLAGLAMGTDKDWAPPGVGTDSAKTPLGPGKVSTDSTTSSMGYFIEPNFRLDKNWYFGARYDYFDPTTQSSNYGGSYQNANTLNAMSVFFNYCMNNGLTFYGEVKQQTTLQGEDATNTALKKNAYSFTLRTFFVW
jgi:hypothetical protein